MKYSTVSGALTWSQGTILLTRGQSIDDDHPLLAERPDLFTDEQTPSITAPIRVQSGMQRPGEVRTERVPTVPAVVKAPPRKIQGQ